MQYALVKNHPPGNVGIPQPDLVTRPQPSAPSHTNQTSTTKYKRVKGLWVTSFIGSKINKEKFSKEIHSDIKFVKAYTAFTNPERNLIGSELKLEQMRFPTWT